MILRWGLTILCGFVLGGCSGDGAGATPDATTSSALRTVAFDEPIEIHDPEIVFGVEPCTDCTLTIHPPVWPGERIGTTDGGGWTADGRYLVLRYTISNNSPDPLEPDDFALRVQVELLDGQRFRGIDLVGLNEISNDLFGVVMSDIVRPGTTGTGLMVIDLPDSIPAGANVIIWDSGGEYAIPLDSQP